MKSPIQIWIGRKCFEEAKPKNYNSRFRKVEIREQYIKDLIYDILVSTIYQFTPTTICSVFVNTKRRLPSRNRLFILI